MNRGVKLIVSIATGLSSESHATGVSRMFGRMGRDDAEWISGAYRHGSKGHILGRQQSYVSAARCPILVAEYPTYCRNTKIHLGYVQGTHR